jgi:acetyl-CoA C-acetyltransferase
MGHRIPGYHIEQACATGLQAALLGGWEVQSGRDVVGVCTFDRTSDSPVGVFPERRAHERTHALADVWDNFGFDPATGRAMIAAAGKTARKYKLDRAEVDDCSYLRYQQYFEAKESGFLDRVLVPLDVLNVSGGPLGRVDGDYGVRKITHAGLRAMRELDTCVTGGGQTHASDGMATLLVTSEEKAKELCRS